MRRGSRIRQVFLASLLILLIVAITVGSPTRAKAQPVGGEFQVNTYTTGFQWRPAVAKDAAGNFVVVWASVYNYPQSQDGNGSGVFGQRYDSAGSPLGGEFQVNTYTTGSQGSKGALAVAADAAGSFVVVWGDHYGRDGIGSGVFGQRYDSTGSPLGGEFQVNTYTSGNQGFYRSGVALAADAAGNFVVVWSSYYQDGSGSGVFAQRYDSAGSPLGGEFQVNTYTTSNQGFEGVAVAAAPAGSFVVVWESGYGSVYGQDGDGPGIFGQRYDSAGSPLGGEFQVNTYTTYGQGYRGVAVAADPAGNFVVVWDSYQDGHGSGVFAQRYDSAGSPLGGEFQVNTFTLDNQGYGGNGDGGVRGVAVATDAAGNFVIAWDSGYSNYPQDGDYWGIFAQRYDSAGTPVGAEFQVNTYTTGSQTPGALAADPAGGFVVVWGSEYQDGNDGHGVFGQRFQAIVPPAPIPGLSAGGSALLGALLTFAMGWARRRRLGSDSRVS